MLWRDRVLGRKVIPGWQGGVVPGQSQVRIRSIIAEAFSDVAASELHMSLRSSFIKTTGA
jgi:hypothetical protein